MTTRTILSFFFVWVLASCSTMEPLDQAPPAEPVAQAPAPSPPPPVVGVKKSLFLLPFDNATGADKTSIQAAVQQMVTTKIASVPQLLLVENDAELARSFQQAQGWPDIYDVAKKLDVDGLISGRVIKLTSKQRRDAGGLFKSRNYHSQAEIELEVHDVATRRVIFNGTFQGDAEEERLEYFDRQPSSQKRLGQAAVSNAMKRALASLEQVASRLSWRGHIARIEFSRYYVTGGRRSGIRPGTLLRVLSPHVSIEDSETGTILGKAPGRFKGLLKVMENFGEDASIASIHSGAGFIESDPIEIHTEGRL